MRTTWVGTMLAVACLAGFATCEVARAISIPVTNSSFESPVVPDPYYLQRSSYATDAAWTAMTGWHTVSNGLLETYLLNLPLGGRLAHELISGDQYAVSYDEGIWWQTLSASLTADNSYVVKALVGAQNFSWVPYAGYEVALIVGAYDGTAATVQGVDWEYVAHVVETNPASIAPNSVITVTIQGVANDLNASWLGKPLVVMFRGKGIGYRAAFDDIRAYYWNGPPPGPAATPIISPNGGVYGGPKQVTITCSTPGAVIRYTDNGTSPTETVGTVIASGDSITVDHNLTLKAIALSDGSFPSDVATAAFTFPTSFDRPADIPYGTAAIDGDLSEWAGSVWAPLDQVYDTSGSSAAALNDEVPEAYYTARWTENKIYMAVKVRDIHHHFRDSYVDWDAKDAVELYIHTTGTGTGPYGATDYSQYQEPAQEWAVGINSTGTGVWSTCGYPPAFGDYTPLASEFLAAGRVNGQWLIYEAAITPYEYFGGRRGNPSVISPLSLYDVIGLDIDLTANNGTTANNGYVGMKSENTKAGKAWYYTTGIGTHRLLAATPVVYTAADLAAVLAAMDAKGGEANWNVNADLDSDGEVTSRDLSIVLANLQ